MEEKHMETSVAQDKPKIVFNPDDYPPLIRRILGNFYVSTGLIALVFLGIVGAWWIAAYQSYENNIFEAVSLITVYEDTINVLINNLFAYVAVLIMIFMPGRSIRLMTNWLNDPEKLNISKSNVKGQEVEKVLGWSKRHSKLIILITIILMTSIGIYWHYLKNYVPVSNPLSPFYDIWPWKSGLSREYSEGPIPSILNTLIASLLVGIMFLYIIDMLSMIYAIRTLSKMISDDLSQREINPYHSDRMGGLKPYSTISILFATYNSLPYFLLLPYISQYVTTTSGVSQLISFLMIGGIFIALAVNLWVMMTPIDKSLKKFKEKFDLKVYDAINSQRFDKTLNMVLTDSPSPPIEDTTYFSSTLSLWTVSANLRSSVLDLDELKRTFIKIAAPLGGFLLKVIL